MGDFDLIDIYKSFLENMPWPVWIEDTESRVIFLNKSYEEVYNIKHEDVVGMTNYEAFGEEKAIYYNQNFKLCMESGEVVVSEGVINGELIEGYIFPIYNNDKKIHAIGGISVNSNHRKEREIEKQKNILRTIIDAVPETIFYKDKEGKFIGYNKNFEEFYKKRGITQIVGKTDLEIYNDKTVAKHFIEQDQEILKNREVKYFEYTIKDEKGNKKVEENVKIPVIDDSGKAWGIVGLSRDITERKHLEERLRYLSQTDILTGLYNRYSFEEKIEELNKEQFLPLGIIMGDVNGLKIVNDTLGHLEGDRMLVDISNIIKDICSKDSYAFRWGGDEFIILVPNSDEKKCEEIIENIISKCQDSEQKFIQLSIALGQVVKYNLKKDVYDCIKKVEEKVYRQKLLEKKSIKSSILESLKKTLEEKNMETQAHTERVVKYSLALGKILGFKIDELDELLLVAKLHDIGKIGINEEILLKPSKLTKEEFEIMKMHTEKGYRIINASSELHNVAKCVLTHHERWDGTGYPLGLKGEEIPIISRIINLVDSYDVMTNNIIYKKALDKKDAIKELEKCSGTQFDPRLVKYFVEYLKNYIT
ncbi:HD domain-containing phosphohydrolase [Romboutsia sp.]|uniref:sensor domain-containing diguanylate cyclase/phosphohydrolase n=1 Tax=Romboutsia sp. TaxID=1965302 RepID=UPI003F3CAF8B